jgi:hypothetical protein
MQIQTPFLERSQRDAPWKAEFHLENHFFELRNIVCRKRFQSVIAETIIFAYSNQYPV